MRLTPERAKQAILHPEQHVREAAVYFFSRSFSQDKNIVPLAIKAIEQYGQDAFETYSFLSGLSHTHETVEWMIHQLATIEKPEEELGTLWAGLALGLRQADPNILKHYLKQVLTLDRLDARFHDAFQKRVYLLIPEPDSIWADLEGFCKRYKDDTDPCDEQIEHADRLAEALSRHPEQMAERVMAVLNAEVQDYQGNPMLWMERYAVQMAGMMRLEEAVPKIVAKLHEDSDWLNDECIWALTRIGTDAVVRAVVEEFPPANWGYRFHATCLLEDIHSDLCVLKCFELVESEDEDVIRRELYKALLINGATDAIELARQWLFANDRDPDWLELRSDLVTAATIMELDFPELSEWKEDMKQDTEFRKQRYAEHVIPRLDLFEEPDDLLEEDDEEFFEENFLDNDDEDFFAEEENLPSVPPTTIVTSKRPGRNDPCPCGSGKKYKKCCLRMEKGAPLN